MKPKTHSAVEHSHDILRQGRIHPLDALFAPSSVALIGASEHAGGVGRALAENLRLFPGRVYFVNPKRPELFKTRTFPDIGSVPEQVDLAIIATPASTVPEVVRECAQAGVGGAVVISAGFKECGPAGKALEQQVLEEARRGRMRLLGPNCLGLMVPHRQLNATFAKPIAEPGQVCFLSQSGALCAAVLDWSCREKVGFSAFVSVGSMADVGWGDLITYFGDDPLTKSIVCYMESIGHARAFLSAAREVALTKPLIVLKVGHSEAAARAAASHTGSLTGSDEVLEAAFRRVGVLRVNAIEELFDMAEVLGKQPRPRGPRLAIVTNAGGPGALAADALVTAGGELAELAEGTRAALDALLPPQWSHGNPIDLLGDASPERYARAVDLAAQDPQSDGVLVILTPQAMTDATGTAERMKPFAQLAGKPILASWMGGAAVAAGDALLNAARISTFAYPDRAARAFAAMWRYSFNLRALYETPLGPAAEEARGGTEAEASQMLESVRAAGRTLLTEVESKRILAAYGIPVVETRTAKSVAQAVDHAQQLGYPVVLKLLSETLTHKTDVGGVQLNLANATAVRRAWRAIETSVRAHGGAKHFLGVTVQPMIPHDGYELIIGSSLDPQFGPVLLFGAGGELVEVMKDRALGLPPLSATLARRLLEQTRIYQALRGVRGRQPVDMAALEQLLVRFSQLICEQPLIKEIDINPLLAGPGRLVALDARVLLHDPALAKEDLPGPAIRPYPVQYVRPWKLKNGTPVLIRPIRPEDEPLMVQFHQTLSERSVYYRYFNALQLQQRIAHDRLARLCFIDYDREMALVVEHQNSKGREILGVGRLSRRRGNNEAEFALTIGDQWQKQGLGTELLRRLVQIGRDERLLRITATILPDNHEMQHVCRKVGFTLHPPNGAGEWQAEIQCGGPDSTGPL